MQLWPPSEGCLDHKHEKTNFQDEVVIPLVILFIDLSHFKTMHMKSELSILVRFLIMKSI